MANRVDPDQKPHSVASDLGLHCLQRPLCPNTRVKTVLTYNSIMYDLFAAMRFLIGNKMDLEKLVSDETIKDFAAAHECDSAFLVSAKTGKT